jgi:hypothetical protein
MKQKPGCTRFIERETDPHFYEHMKECDDCLVNVRLARTIAQMHKEVNVSEDLKNRLFTRIDEHEAKSRESGERTTVCFRLRRSRSA